MRLSQIRGPSIPVFQAPPKEEIEISPGQVANFNPTNVLRKAFEPIAKGSGVPLYCYQEGTPQFQQPNTDATKLVSKKSTKANRITIEDLVMDFDVRFSPELEYDKGIRPGKRPLQP